MMSMFYCDACDGLRDADDGCEERPGNKLICVECADGEGDEAAWPATPTTCIETIGGDPNTALRLSFQIKVF
jgi:hypothetical protein